MSSERPVIVRSDETAVYHAPGAPGRLVKVLTTLETTGARGAVVGVTVCVPGCRGDLHTHRGEELIVVIHGCGKFFTEKEEYVLGPGDFIFIPPGVRHGYENIDAAEPLEFLWVYPVTEDVKPIEEKWVKVREHKLKGRK